MQFLDNLVDPAAHGLVTVQVLLVVYGVALFGAALGVLWRQRPGLLVMLSGITSVMLFVAVVTGMMSLVQRNYHGFVGLEATGLCLEVFCLTLAVILGSRRLRNWASRPLVVTLVAVALVNVFAVTVFMNTAAMLNAGKPALWFSTVALAAALLMSVIAGRMWFGELRSRWSHLAWWRHLQWLGAWAPVPPITHTDDDGQRDT